jgi:hypothetical protein
LTSSGYSVSIISIWTGVHASSIQQEIARVTDSTHCLLGSITSIARRIARIASRHIWWIIKLWVTTIQTNPITDQVTTITLRAVSRRRDTKFTLRVTRYTFFCSCVRIVMQERTSINTCILVKEVVSLAFCTIVFRARAL